MYASGHPVNAWVNAGDVADGSGNVQLRQSRIITARQNERIRAQAQCQARHSRAEAHKQARKAEQRMTEQLQRDNHVLRLQALHAAALGHAHEAQEKARVAKLAADQAEVAAEAKAETRRANAKQRFAQAVSKIKTERQRMQESAISRKQRSAHIKQAEKQRAAARVKAAQASRRCDLSLDARYQGKQLPQPAGNIPAGKSSCSQAKATVSQLQRQKAAERGRAALRRARQQRRAEELSRQLRSAERAKQLHRAQPGSAMGAPSQVPHGQGNMQHEAAASEHQPALHTAQLTAGGSSAMVEPGMLCQQAEQAGASQAPLTIIAQTHWQLQSVRPELHDLLKSSTERLQSARTAGVMALHGKAPSKMPPRNDMARGRRRHASEGAKAMPSKSILRQDTARVQFKALSLQKAPAQTTFKTRPAMKQLDRSDIAKNAQNCGLQYHPRTVPSLVRAAVSHPSRDMAEGCSVGATQKSGLSLRLNSHRRSACAGSADERRSASTCFVSAAARHTGKASKPTGRTMPASSAAAARIAQNQPMVKDNAYKRRLFSNPLADSSIEVDTKDTTQQPKPNAMPAEANEVNPMSPCSPSEDFPWPALSLEHQGSVPSGASAERKEGTFSSSPASPYEVPRQACSVKPHPPGPPVEMTELAAFKACTESLRRDTYAGQAIGQQHIEIFPVQCEQPTNDSIPDREVSKGNFHSISLIEDSTLDCGRNAAHPTYSTDLAADKIPVMPGIAGLDHGAISLDAAAEQLEAVCRQLLQGLAIPDCLKSSLEAGHEADVRHNSTSRSTDVLAGLVAELEADMAAV